MAILLKAIYRLNVTPIKLAMTFFIELEQRILKFIWNHNRLRIAKAIWRKKEQSKMHNLPGFQKILQSYSNQNSMVLAQKQIYRSIEHNRVCRNKPTHLCTINLWQTRQEVETNTTLLSQLYSNKFFLEKNIQWGKDSLFTKWCWKSQTATCKLIKLEHTLTPYTKTNSKRLKDLNIKKDIIKLLEENIGKTFSDINHTNVFLGQSPKATEIKTKINKRDLIKLVSFCTPKETINETKRQPMDWKKIFANDGTDEDLISEIYKQLIQFNKKKTNSPTKKNGPVNNKCCRGRAKKGNSLTLLGEM